MKKASALLYIIIVAMLFALCAPVPAALAAGATSVWVNGVELKAATPYWQNGSGSASATEPVGGWNAHFDAATATLTLKDAELTDYSLVPPSLALNAYSFILPDGELSIVLNGSNSIVFTGTDPPGGSEPSSLFGFISDFDTAIYGPGSLDIRYTTYNSQANFCAVFTYDNLTIYGGTINISAANPLTVIGLRADKDFWIAGGNITIQETGDYLILLDAGYGEFRMTGGSVEATGEGRALVDTRGLLAKSIQLSGGTATVKVTSPTIDAYGLKYEEGDLNITGGYFVFMGSTAAINNSGFTDAPAAPPTNMQVFVSDDIDGVNKQRWTSPAGGELATNTVYSRVSPFRYAEFVFTPQTGDGQTPLWWAGLAMLVLLGAAGMLLAARKRRT